MTAAKNAPRLSISHYYTIREDKVVTIKRDELNFGEAYFYISCTPSTPSDFTMTISEKTGSDGFTDDRIFNCIDNLVILEEAAKIIFDAVMNPDADKSILEHLFKIYYNKKA